MVVTFVIMSGHWLLIFLLLSPTFAVQMRQERYVSDTKFCDLSEKVDSGCTNVIEEVVSVNYCSILCSNFDGGYGISYDATQNKCYLNHCPEPPASTCNQQEEDSIKHFRRNCVNGGIWDFDLKVCNCSGGFVGYRCERYAQGCSELRNWRYFGEMLVVKILPPDMTNPYETYCTLTAENTLTYVALNTGSGLFNRSWEDYKDVFVVEDGMSLTDFWLGMNNLSFLTTDMSMQTFVINIDLYVLGVKTSFKFTYSGFVISDEASDYSYIYSSVSYSAVGPLNTTTQLQSCLEESDVAPGIPFSTPDIDNDNDTVNHCANEAQAGWWFDQCSSGIRCNLLGAPYITGIEDVTPDRLTFDGADARVYTKGNFVVSMYLEEAVTQ